MPFVKGHVSKIKSIVFSKKKMWESQSDPHLTNNVAKQHPTTFMLNFFFLNNVFSSP